MCISETLIRRPTNGHNGEFMFMKVPCGKCPKCARVKLAQWNMRFEYEMRRSHSPLFVTLTYNDACLPRFWSDLHNNEVPSLYRYDVQLFMKRLRHHVSKKYHDNPPLKYICVGEYGTRYQRPHYHMVLLNLPDVSLIHSTWSMGFTYSPPLREGGLGYVLKYISKPQNFHSYDGRERPKTMSSKMIGSNYLTPSIIEYHNRGAEYSCISFNGKKVPLPRYFKNKVYDAEMYGKVSAYMSEQSDIRALLKRKEYRVKHPNHSDSEMEHNLALELFNVKHYERFETMEDSNLEYAYNELFEKNNGKLFVV